MRLRHTLLAAALLLPVASFAQSAAVQTALEYLSDNFYDVVYFQSDLADLEVTDAYTSRRSGTTHVYVRQRHQGIGIFDANYTVNVNRDGHVFHADGSFVPDLNTRVAEQPNPAISPSTAVNIVANEIGVQGGTLIVIESEGGPDQAVVYSNDTIARLPIEARLVYRPEADTTPLRLVWEVTLYQSNDEHFWYAHVDAQTGDIAFLHDMVTHDNWGPEGVEAAPLEMVDVAVEDYIQPMAPVSGFTSRYAAFPLPIESPDHSTPPLPSDGRQLLEDPENLTASPFGWHDTNGVAGAEDNLSRGNNGDAHKGATRADGGAALDFNFTANFANSPLTFIPAVISNNFYLMNVIHDFTYLYGFDEISGNFQENNYGNGGAGSDGVNSNVQASGNCNANFGTPSDGSNPTMNMYLCSSPNPDSDSSLDTSVLFHEYAHGISNRLTGGPGNVSCLNNAEQMGEGWSDLLGLIPTIKPGDVGTGSRPLGEYFIPTNFGTPGVRHLPYSTNQAINDHDYCDITPYGSNSYHDIGEVWASIIWEVTWKLIDAYGFEPDIYNVGSSAGNVVMMQLLIEGMKLQPCSPGFVSGRDAILAADVSLYGGAHLFELWEGFSIRGLGDGANQGSSGNANDNTCDFVNPIPVELVSFNSTVDGSTVVLDWFTSSETNNAGFEVQHRTEGGTYEVLGFVEGHGTTTEEQSYSFRAEGMDVGTHTFRLKQIDFDGAFELSQEIEVVVGVVGSHTLSEVYPNPFNPQAQFTLAVPSNQNVTIAVFDVMGRQVATLFDGQLEANQPTAFTVDGSALASGTYIIRIAGQNFVDSRRITLVK